MPTPATVKLSPTARNLLATVVVLGLLVTCVGAAVYSAYTGVTSNDGNRFQAGSIDLTANDQGSALFDVKGFVPGDSFVRCIQVTFSATDGIRSQLRLYGGTGGDGLDQYLDLRIRRGTTPSTNPPGDCTGFTPDAADYRGDGPGVIASSTLRAFPEDWVGGVEDPSPAWSDGDSAVYEIRLTVQNDNAAQQLSATQDFSFEARTL